MLYVRNRENPDGPAYNLMTTFPRKVLTDMAATLAASGLINAAVQQTQ